MTFRRFVATPISALAVMIGLFTIISLGGCPVQQTPRTPAEQQDQTTDPSTTDNNQRDLNRPIPPPPTEDDGDGTGGGGGSTGGSGGGILDGDTDVSQPISVVITSPDASNINILPSGEGSVTYEVFGGDAADGAIAIELFYDVDGVFDTGDEVMLKAGLATRGTEKFGAAAIAPGTYRVGVHAFNNVEEVVTYANGRLVVVGVPTISFTQPNADVRVRPNSAVTVQFAIDSLASTVSYEVFTDTDTVVNGNEIAAFNGGGLNGSGTIFLESFGAGTYYIGVTVRDSVGQEMTKYFPGAGSELRKIIVDLAPTVAVTEPSLNRTASPGQQVDLTVSVTVSDPEANATVTIFRDGDGIFNGNEATLATQQLNSSQQTISHDVDTTSLVPGTYRFGASVNDGVGAPVAAYAAGRLIIDSAPAIAITNPNSSRAVRPGENVNIRFSVTDPENSIKQQPNGVKIVLAEANAGGQPKDQNNDGKIDDSDIVYDIGPSGLGLGGNQNYNFNTSATQTEGLLDADGNGEFKLGIRVEDMAGNVVFKFANGVLSVDSVVPEITLVSPSFPQDKQITLDRIDDLTIEVSIDDTSAAGFMVLLDPDLNTTNQNEIVLVAPTEWNPGDANPQFSFNSLEGFEAGNYFVSLVVADLVPPAEQHYAPASGNQSNPDALNKIRIRDRYIGRFELEDLATGSDDGAILQGYNFNDLAGSSMIGVPDLTGDETNEFLVVSRFGKSYQFNDEGVGIGEAQLVYSKEGSSPAQRRLKFAQSLNAVGRGSIAGVPFTGIRMKNNTKWSAGMSDATVIPDMDGDNLPELAFSFPRVESVSLIVADSRVQLPELAPDLVGMGGLEYNAWNGQTGVWTPNVAQFTRGGIVIVSSHNELLKRDGLLNRKFNRVIDLHEVGQLFNSHSQPSYVPYIRQVVPGNPPETCRDCETNVYDDSQPPECTEGCGDCGGNPENPAESLIRNYVMQWDVIFNNQGPGGFHMPWTSTLANPPLANPRQFPYTTMVLNLLYPPPTDPCSTVDNREGCNWANTFFTGWSPPNFPCTTLAPTLPSWNNGGSAVWTGFYGPASSPYVDPTSGAPSTVGARVLGQSVNDRFGTTVSCDGTWLYIAAPEHTALKADVPALSGNRTKSGVVYQYRVDTRSSPNNPTRSQLWIEPGKTWPTPDREISSRSDYTIPVPHQYIIETVGSTRGNSGSNENDFTYPGNGCLPSFAATGGAQADVAGTCYDFSYQSGSAGYNMDRTPQIVGAPQSTGFEARISDVRAIGDTNDDGIRDFIVGTPNHRDGNGNQIGGVFIVHARQTGLEGDYLLERMSYPPNDPLRQNGVLLVGAPGAVISRAFDSAGDFNNDGIDDVIVGSENGGSGNGEALVVLGSRTLLSPANGYPFDQIVAEGKAIRFVGAASGDLAGANVAGAGDVDGDGIDDVLISAPKATDPDSGQQTGLVYLVYGSSLFQGGDSIDLSLVGTRDVKGIVFVGRSTGDELGGGSKVVTGTDPSNSATTAYSRGVSALGDIDGDGRDDYAISAMLADPFGKTDAGEVYILYGRGD